MRRAGGIVVIGKMSGKMGDNIHGGREVLFELTRIGNAVKVTAVDAATGVEASIVGAPAMGEEMLKRNALRKLDYVLKRRG